MMSTMAHNLSQMPIYNAVRDRFQWFLGIELGRDPRNSAEDMMELEERLADWLINKGGSEWLRSMPGVLPV